MRTFLLLLSAVLLGCGADGPFQYIPVAGQVEYDDGTPMPATGFQLNFFALDAPQVAGASPRPAIAHVAANGRFDCVTSYKHCDGLVPGRHRVAVVHAEQDGKLFVPKAYTSPIDSPLVIDTDEAPLTIRVPKP